MSGRIKKDSLQWKDVLKHVAGTQMLNLIKFESLDLCLMFSRDERQRQMLRVVTRHKGSTETVVVTHSGEVELSALTCTR